MPRPGRGVRPFLQFEEEWVDLGQCHDRGFDTEAPGQLEIEAVDNKLVHPGDEVVVEPGPPGEVDDGDVVGFTGYSGQHGGRNLTSPGHQVFGRRGVHLRSLHDDPLMNAVHGRGGAQVAAATQVAAIKHDEGTGGLLERSAAGRSEGSCA